MMEPVSVLINIYHFMKYINMQELPNRQDIQDALEEYIHNGTNPLDALVIVAGPYIGKLTFKSVDLSGKLDLEKHQFIRNILARLNLTSRFIQKYFIYRSGQIRSTIKDWQNISPVVLGDKTVILTTIPEFRLYGRRFQGIKYDGVRLYSGNIIHPYFAVIDGPSYIPVTGYGSQSSSYFLEPESGLYLLSQATLIVPSMAMGLFALLGANENAINTMLNQYYIPGDDMGTMAFVDDMITNYKRISSGQPLVPLKKNFLFTYPTETIQLESAFYDILQNRNIDTAIVYDKPFSAEVYDVRMHSSKYLYRIFSGKEAENIIESQINNGLTPEDALANLISQYDMKFAEKWKQERLSYYFGNNFKILADNEIFPELKLTRPFVTKWFVYPSGKARNPMKYVKNILNMKLSEIPIVITSKLTPPIFRGIHMGNEIRNITCAAIVEGSLYIPVLRYQEETGVGYINMSKKSEYDSRIHCGTYYYIEPDSNVYLISHKTLIAPFSEIAYYYLLGADEKALRTLVSDSFEIENISSDQQFYIDDFAEKIVQIYDQCIHGEPVSRIATLPSPKFRDTKIKFKDIEQKLCSAAQQKGIDTVLLTLSHKPTGSEIFDTRQRSDTYNYLFRLL